MNDQKNVVKFSVALGVVVLALIALLGHLTWSAYRETLNAAQTRTVDYAEILNAHLESTLRRTDAILLQIARSTPIAALDQRAAPSYAKELEATLDLAVHNFPEVSGLRITDAGGQVIYTSKSPPSARVSIGERGYFRSLRDGRQTGMVISEVIVSNFDKQQRVVAARALRDAQGVFRGTVFVAINLAHLRKLFQSLNVGAGGNVTLYRSDDFTRVLHHPHTESLPGGPLPPTGSTRIAVASGSREGSLEFTSFLDGRVRIARYHVLEGFPLFVSVNVAKDEVLAGWRARSLEVGFAGAFLVTLLGVLFFRLWRSEAARARAMSDTVEVSHRMAAIIDASHDAIISVDEEGRVVTFSNAAEKMFQTTAAETVGQTLDRFIPERFHQAHHGHMREFGASGVSARAMGQYARVVALRADGVEFPIEASICNLAIGGKRLFSATLRDITLREQATQAQARLAAIVENSRDAIVSRETDNKITSWNAAAEQMFGYSADEVLGRDTALLIPPDRLLLAARNRELIKRGEGEMDVETVRLRKDGTPIAVSLRVSPITAEAGTVVGLSMVYRDITARVRARATRASLEEQLRESHKMQAVGTLAGGIAHDFNNILAAILGNLELACMDIDSNHPVREKLAEIETASQRARDLVKQILTFSRRQPQDHHIIDLRTIANEATRLLRATLPTGIEISTHFAPDTPMVRADATQMQQVIMNLGTNAWHAIAGNIGRIELSLAPALIDGDLIGEMLRIDLPPGRYARLDVCDTGAGMDDATIKRIFDPFFTTKAPGHGTGLGLSVVDGILKSHGGAITVYSEPGKGSRFHLYLPAAENGAQYMPAITAPPETKRGNRQSILFLDDEEALVRLAKRLLDRLGYAVTGHTVAAQAFAAFRADPSAFDLIITDYNMPHISGLEVAGQMLQLRPNIPLLLSSGFITDELRAEALALGIREILDKPIDAKYLAEVIDRTIGTGGR